MPYRRDRADVDGVAAVVYVLAATALSYLAVQDDGGNSAESVGLLVLASLMGAATHRRAMYWLPFAPWALLSLGVYATTDRTAGWEELWFFNLAILGVLGVLAIALARAVRTLVRRSRT